MSEGPGQRGITAPERLTLLTSISSVLLQRKRERVPDLVIKHVLTVLQQRTHTI